VIGAEGKNAMDTLQRSKPDGHTMSLLNVGVYVGLSTKKSPYSWNVKDLPVLLGIDTPPYGIFVNPKSPYSNYQDIVKTQTAIRIALGTANFAVIPLLADFDKKGIQYKVARFKGSAEANLAVIAGNAELTSGPLSGINAQPILAGDFRLLWLYDTKRLAMFPNVPTHVELGMPKEWSHYRVARLIQVPPGTPEHIQKALREALIKALRDKRTIEWSKTVDTPVGVLSESELKERINFLIKGFSENPNIVEAYF
jgi:tripartite-type tricarboxylate transporter receptor subunit TctC